MFIGSYPTLPAEDIPTMTTSISFGGNLELETLVLEIMCVGVSEELLVNIHMK